MWERMPTLCLIMVLLTQCVSMACGQIFNVDFDVLESAQPQVCVYNISAPIGTTCTQPPSSIPFSVDNTNLCVQVTAGQALDFEAMASNPRIGFQLTCTTPTPSTIIFIVTANVIDVNDHTPTFTPPVINVTLPESSRSQTLVTNLIAVDPDSGASFGIASVVYKLDPTSNVDNLFQIISSRGVPQLVLRGMLDREKKSGYTIIVFGEDGGGRVGHLIVYITVGDVNDNPPEFVQTSYQASRPEDLALHMPILTVHAIDKDTNANALVQYSIVRVTPGNGSLLGISPTAGGVRSVQSPLPLGTHVFIVYATDGVFTANATLTLIVLDVNDIAPTLTRSCFHTLEFEEPGPAPGTVICQFTVTDGDQGLNGVVNMTLFNGDGMFDLDLADPTLQQTPVVVPIKVTGRLDFENKTRYDLSLQVTDNGSPPQANTGSLLINVNDTNEFAPVFQPDGYPITLYESLDRNEPVERVMAVDPDGSNSAITYSIAGASNFFVMSWFRIDPSTGVIYTAGSLDREISPTFNLTVEARDTGIRGGTSIQLASTTIVQVTLLDVNDNSPRFFSLSYSADIAENSRAGAFVIRVVASDTDSGNNGTVEYRLLNPDGTASSDFSVDEFGNISVASGSQLDRETKDLFNLTCVASDKGRPPLSSRVSVLINVTDINDHPPVLYPLVYACNIQENLPSGQLCTRVMATDDDLGLNSKVYYSIVGGDTLNRFSVDNATGDLRTNSPLDAEVRNIYSLKVRAVDALGLVSLTDATINISVVNTRDKPPVFFDPDYSFSVTENASVSAVVGAVLATSQDIGSPPGLIIYSITGGDAGNHFAINQSTGVITVNSALDREQVSFFELVVGAQEIGVPPLYASVTVNVSIVDVNDNPPNFGKRTDTVKVPECHPINNQSIYTANATDSDFNRAGRVRYSLLNDTTSGFAIDRFSGAIILKSHLDYESIQYETVLIKAADRGQIRLTSTLTLIVQVQVMVIYILL